MKTSTPLLAFLLFLLSCQLFAQNSLVGTWEFLSAKGADNEGKAVAMDASTMREIKLINPTHYIFIAENIQGDSTRFNKCQAGTVYTEGSKYFEIPMRSSQSGDDKVRTDFTWQVKGDKFIRQGAIILPDGKKITVDELTFQKVKVDHVYPAHAGIGSWYQTATSWQSASGEKGVHSSATHTKFQIMTPSHWMRITHKKDGTFEHAMGGTYTMQGDKLSMSIIQASDPKIIGYVVQVTQRAKGNKLYWKEGIAKDATGKQVLTFEDTFQKADAKSPKTASN